MNSAVSDVKRITLEMGGNDAAIVREDVDPAEVAPKVSQICVMCAVCVLCVCLCAVCVLCV